MASCHHFERTQHVPSHKASYAKGCGDCLKSGDTWVHLRECLVCGHVGCCDSSKNKHAIRHFHATKHPVMRSVEPGETWGWCFVDEGMADLSGPGVKASFCTGRCGQTVILAEQKENYKRLWQMNQFALPCAPTARSAWKATSS